MKRTICALLAALFLFSLAFPLLGCANEKNEVVFRRLEENLYEVTYEDYDPEFSSQKNTVKLSELPVLKNAPGGCSAARVGNFVGRNLDLPYADVSEVIVHVPAAKGRYASVASFCTLKKLTGETIQASDLDETFAKLIPLSVCDGINENGVVCEMNVVPAKDVAMTTGTNPGKPTLNMGNVVRFVLDNASSAKDAVEKLGERNLCVPWDWSGAASVGWEFHYLIADATDTFVVEVLNDRLIVLEGETVLTNYYLAQNGGSDHGMGIERREILLAHRDMADSVKGTANLMALVYWTKSNDVDSENYCYSDHFGAVAADGTVIVKSNYKNYLDDLKKAGETDAALTEEMLKTGQNPYGLWVTLHTCVFDIPARTLTFSMLEHTDKTRTFSIAP